MNLEEQIQEALKSVNYPGYSRDIVSFGLVKGVAAANGSAGIDLELTTHNPEVAAQLKAECETVVKALDGIERAMVQVKMPPAGQAPAGGIFTCLLYTSPSPRDKRQSRMPSSA